MPVIGMVLAGTGLTVLLAVSFIPGQRMLVSFPDVGQGDCALIELPGGETVLIDGGGTRDNRFDIGRRILAPWLWNKGIRRLDLVIMSHPHPDHMNGLIAILRKFEVGAVWESGLDTDLPGYGEFRQAVQDRKIRHRLVSADDPPMMLGEAMISVLHPRRGFEAHDRQAYAAENNRSLVVRIRSEGKDFLFTGDIGSEDGREHHEIDAGPKDRPYQGPASWKQKLEQRRICITNAARNRGHDGWQGEPVSSSFR